MSSFRVFVGIIALIAGGQQWQAVAADDGDLAKCKQAFPSGQCECSYDPAQDGNSADEKIDNGVCATGSGLSFIFHEFPANANATMDMCSNKISQDSRLADKKNIDANLKKSDKGIYCFACEKFTSTATTTPASAAPSNHQDQQCFTEDVWHNEGKCVKTSGCAWDNGSAQCVGYSSSSSTTGINCSCPWWIALIVVGVFLLMGLAGLIVWLSVRHKNKKNAAVVSQASSKRTADFLNGSGDYSATPVSRGYYSGSFSGERV